MWSPWMPALSRFAQTLLGNHTLCFQLPLLHYISPKLPQWGHRCKIHKTQWLPYELVNEWGVLESTVLPPLSWSTSLPWKVKSTHPTKWFSLTSHGDKVHFEATLRGLSTKVVCNSELQFKSQLFSQQVKWKSFLMDPTSLQWKPTSPMAPPNELYATAEREINVKKAVISPLM